jgi:anti-anti-sigma regulatory factor
VKLNLKRDKAYPILEVTEEIASRDAQILKLGVMKMFEFAKKAILIDITQARFDAGGVGIFLDIYCQGLLRNIKIVFVGSHPTLCHAPDQGKGLLLATQDARLHVATVPLLGLLKNTLTNSKNVYAKEPQGDELKAKVLFEKMEHQRIAVLVKSMTRQLESLEIPTLSSKPMGAAEGKWNETQTTYDSILAEKGFK